MDATDRIADRLALHALSADYAYWLDRNEVDALLDLFTPDAVYSNGARRSEGHAALRAFLTARRDGGRASRHFYSGLRLAFETADHAVGTSLWISYAQDGPLPLREAEPFAIADFNDVYLRGADGRWRFRERHIQPVYSNSAVPLPGSAAEPGA